MKNMSESIYNYRKMASSIDKRVEILNMKMVLSEEKY